MSPSREVQGKHDASAEVSEITSPESELATPPDEHIFELPHERALRLTPSRSNTVDLPERTPEAVAGTTASMPEVSQERERSHNVPSTNIIPELSHEQALRQQQTESNATANPVSARLRGEIASMAEVPLERNQGTPRSESITSANDERDNIVPPTNAVSKSSHNQASHQQQTQSDSTAVPGLERSGDDIVSPTTNMAEIPHERGRSLSRTNVSALADTKPGSIAPSNLPTPSDKQAPRQQQPGSNSTTEPASLDGPPERGVRTNLPSLSTNQTSDQEFAPVFDESPGLGEKPVTKPQDKPVERKDSALAQAATDTSGVMPLTMKDKLWNLVPYATPLSIRDLDRCFALEQDCFPGRNYCTKEQVGHVCSIVCGHMLFR